MSHTPESNGTPILQVLVYACRRCGQEALSSNGGRCVPCGRAVQGDFQDLASLPEKLRAEALEGWFAGR